MEESEGLLLHNKCIWDTLSMKFCFIRSMKSILNLLILNFFWQENSPNVVEIGFV